MWGTATKGGRVGLMHAFLKSSYLHMSLFLEGPNYAFLYYGKTSGENVAFVCS